VRDLAPPLSPNGPAAPLDVAKEHLRVGVDADPLLVHEQPLPIGRKILGEAHVEPAQVALEVVTADEYVVVKFISMDPIRRSPVGDTS